MFGVSMNMLSSTFSSVKDFLFSTSCFNCGAQLKNDERRVCEQCWNSLSNVGEHDYTFNVLKERFREGGVIDEFVSLYYFEKGKLLQHLAHSLKYEEITAFGFELGVQLGNKLRDKNIDCVIPVPLNKRKERERGYNQSDFVAKGISSIINVPVFSDVVRRVKYTVTQTHLNAQERKKNIAEAFAVTQSEKIKNKNILIVDDIITTGSTIQETAKVLMDSGATKVIAGSVGLAKLGEDS